MLFMKCWHFYLERKSYISMNKKNIKIMAACFVTVLLISNVRLDICYAMNKTETEHACAGEAYVTVSITANGNKTSYNASSPETSDFSIQGYVYDNNNYKYYSHDAYQTSACSFSDTWNFEPDFAEAVFNVGGYTGDCTIRLNITNGVIS